MQGLALCLVDSHYKGWLPRKLPVLELAIEREHRVCWAGVDAGAEGNFAYAAPNYYLSFNDI